MFQHLLVPLDGSARAEYALPVAAKIARATQGVVHLVRVVWLQLDAYGGLPPVSLKNEEEEATLYLQKQASSPLLEGVPTRVEVLLGQPASSLLEFMQTHEIDLLVLCSHGRTGFPRWALGSVAHTLLHRSSIPALLLHQNDASVALVDA